MWKQIISNWSFRQVPQFYIPGHCIRWIPSRFQRNTSLKQHIQGEAHLTQFPHHITLRRNKLCVFHWSISSCSNWHLDRPNLYGNLLGEWMRNQLLKKCSVKCLQKCSTPLIPHINCVLASANWKHTWIYADEHSYSSPQATVMFG